ncbi:hypothetical protein QTN25_007480 [Entamoeba marina]
MLPTRSSFHSNLFRPGYDGGNGDNSSSLPIPRTSILCDVPPESPPLRQSQHRQPQQMLTSTFQIPNQYLKPTLQSDPTKETVLIKNIGSNNLVDIIFALEKYGKLKGIDELNGLGVEVRFENSEQAQELVKQQFIQIKNMKYEVVNHDSSKPIKDTGSSLLRIDTSYNGIFKYVVKIFDFISRLWD